MLDSDPGARIYIYIYIYIERERERWNIRGSPSSGGLRTPTTLKGGLRSPAPPELGIAMPPELGIARNSVCFWLTFSSPLGPRTEISAQNRREIAHNFVAHFLFTQNYKQNIQIRDFVQGTILVKKSPGLGARARAQWALGPMGLGAWPMYFHKKHISFS